MPNLTATLKRSLSVSLTRIQLLNLTMFLTKEILLLGIVHDDSVSKCKYRRYMDLHSDYFIG